MIQFHYAYPGFKVSSATDIKSWLTRIARSEKKKIDRLEYIFTSDEELKAINIRSLDHDYYTDILTFPYSYIPIEGEIYISIDRIKDHAAKYKVRFDQELHRVMAHGLLHLCGYNDQTQVDKLGMTRLEDKYLCLL
jgi:rRNA maturation RNase YbeY